MINDKHFKVQNNSKPLWLRVALWPFPTLQNFYPVGEGGFIYQTLKIVFGRVICISTTVLTVDNKSESDKIKSLEVELTQHQHLSPTEGNA